ncbi:MAG: baseplate J/gp47 family protein [Lachnospiraceae bacterium]|nr:baseplate J/gp47 family protein [Lachnospiraceae bacterium]
MISNKILDAIFPQPTLDELKEQTIAELENEGFAITNFKSGGVFHTLLMVNLEIYVELIDLFRRALSNMFIKHAEGEWIELKSQDYGKTRKPAAKAKGILTLTGSKGHATLTIPAGTTFKTDRDINGEELRYFSTASVTLLDAQTEVHVPVEAEKEGALYNVPQGRITNCTRHLEGVEGITNAPDWLTTAGADVEDLELLRARVLNSWADLATGTTAAKYKSAAEKVPGVLYSDVDQLHPRGQGSVDIIITSTAGEASEELLLQVEEAVQETKGEYDNLLVKSAETVHQDVSVTVELPELVSGEGVEEKVRYAVESYFKVGVTRKLNELVLLDLYIAIKQEVPVLKNIKITEPTSDLKMAKGNVILLGALNVTVTWEEQDV